MLKRASSDSTHRREDYHLRSVGADASTYYSERGEVAGIWLGGTLVFSAGTEGGAAWGANGRLYFFGNGGLQVLDLATQTTKIVLSAVHGWNPTVSPDGRYIAYERRDPAPPEEYFGGYGPAWLELGDLEKGTIDGGFHFPGGHLASFVTPTQVWFTGPDTSAPVVSYDVTRQTQSSTGGTGMVMDVRYQGSR